MDYTPLHMFSFEISLKLYSKNCLSLNTKRKKKKKVQRSEKTAVSCYRIPEIKGNCSTKMGFSLSWIKKIK